MAKLSIIIPARNEGQWLEKTIADILAKATGDIEILVGVDGLPYPERTIQDHRVWYYAYPEPRGLKPIVNELALKARGQYMMKTDAHCMFSEGFDEVLQAGMQDNWIVMPRLYILDAENWRWQDERFYDHFHLMCPLTDAKQYRFQAGGNWPERTAARLDVAPWDETMGFHGACWFANRDYFLNCIGGLSIEGYGPLFMETFELEFKTWLGPWDGRVMVNKAAWYAHMHKGGQRPRGYGISWRANRSSYDFTAHYWMENRWPDRVHDLEWLIDRFWPVPTWPDNWRELQVQYERKRYAHEYA